MHIYIESVWYGRGYMWVNDVKTWNRKYKSLCKLAIGREFSFTLIQNQTHVYMYNWLCVTIIDYMEILKKKKNINIVKVKWYFINNLISFYSFKSSNLIILFSLYFYYVFFSFLPISTSFVSLLYQIQRKCLGYGFWI